MSAAASPSSLDGFSLAAPTAGFLDDPYPTYDELRWSSPLHWLGHDSVLLTRHEDVLAVYRSAHASSDKRREFAPKFGTGSPLYEHHTTSLVFNDPPAHTRVRRILMGALDQRAIARMEPGVRTLVHTLLDGLADRRAPDLIEHFAARIPVEVIGNLLDVPRAERGPLRDWSLAILSALEPAPSPQALDRGNAAVTAYKDYLTGLIDRRQRHPGDPQVDLLTRLIDSDSQGRLSPSELTHNCIFLLNAGHETTANLIGNGAHALLAHRDQFERLVREPELIGTAVEELLRFESPLQLNNRQALAPLVVGSGEIPVGTFVTLCIGAANRDPAMFDDPHRLDIGRRPNNHLAFGQGSHACSGMNVARMEARIALGELVRRFPRMQLADRPPERDRRVRFRGFRSLPVRLD